MGTCEYSSEVTLELRKELNMQESEWLFRTVFLVFDFWSLQLFSVALKSREVAFVQVERGLILFQAFSMTFKVFPEEAWFARPPCFCTSWRRTRFGRV